MKIIQLSRKASSVAIPIIGVLLSTITEAKQCLFVSGHKRDAAGTLTEYRDFISQNGQIAGNSCIFFDGWDQLMDYASNLQNSREDLLIFQMSHGKKEGYFKNNQGDQDTFDKVYGYLKELSKTHKIGFLTNACYSGDLLKKKLIDDEKNSPEDVSENLCIVTGSPFARASLAYPSEFGIIKNVRQGASMEDLFSNLNQYDLISSSPWSSSGLSRFFIPENPAFESSNAKKILEQITRSVENEKNKEIRDSAIVLLRSDINVLQYQALSVANTWYHYVSYAAKGRVSSAVMEKYTNNLKEDTIHSSCISAWLKNLSKKSVKGIAYQYLRFKKSSDYDHCSLMGMSDPEIRDLLLGAFPKIKLLSSFYELVGYNWNLDRQLWRNMTLKELKVIYGKERNGLVSEFIELAASAAKPQLILGDDEKKLSLISGDSFLEYDRGYSQLYGSYTDIRLSNIGNPASVLHAFSHGGTLVSQEEMTEVRDQRRRRACRSIVF